MSDNENQPATAAEIRVWAADHGFDVLGKRGRLPVAAVEAFAAAHPHLPVAASA